MPGTSALAAKYDGQEPAVLEERKDLTPDFIKFVVRHGVSIMPPFRKTEITDAELSVLADYLSHKPIARPGSTGCLWWGHLRVAMLSRVICEG
jgi:hypothetical protein